MSRKEGHKLSPKKKFPAKAHRCKEELSFALPLCAFAGKLF
jgi:hypothetical protein